jgi:hypothetical protein
MGNHRSQPTRTVPSYDCLVIDLNQFTNGIFMGFVLISLGLVPGLYQNLAEGLLKFGNFAHSRLPVPIRTRTQFPQPRWFAPLGALVLVASIVAFCAK